MLNLSCGSQLTLQGSIKATVQVASGSPTVAVTSAVSDGTICLTISGQAVCAQSTNALDYCQPNPCKNGAVCTNTDSGPLCSCSTSFCGDCCAQLADSSCPGGADQQCNSPQSQSSSSSSSSPVAPIAGAACGLVLLVVIIVLVWRRHHKQGEVLPAESVPSRDLLPTSTAPWLQPYCGGENTPTAYDEFDQTALDHYTATDDQLMYSKVSDEPTMYEEVLAETDTDVYEVPVDSTNNQPAYDLMTVDPSQHYDAATARQVDPVHYNSACQQAHYDTASGTLGGNPRDRDVKQPVYELAAEDAQQPLYSTAGHTPNPVHSLASKMDDQLVYGTTGHPLRVLDTDSSLANPNACLPPTESLHQQRASDHSTLYFAQSECDDA